VDSRAAATGGAWVVGFEAQRYPLHSYSGGDTHCRSMKKIWLPKK